MSLPGAEDFRRLLETRNHADRGFYWKAMLFEHLNYFAEIPRQGIARAQNVNLLLDEEPGFVVAAALLVLMVLPYNVWSIGL